MTESKRGRLMCLALLVLGAPYISPYAVFMMVVYRNQKQYFGAAPTFQLIADLTAPVVAVLMLAAGIVCWFACLGSLVEYLCRPQAVSPSPQPEAGSVAKVHAEPQPETIQSKLESLGKSITGRADYEELSKVLTIIIERYQALQSSSGNPAIKLAADQNLDTLIGITTTHLRQRAANVMLAADLATDYLRLVDAANGCSASLGSQVLLGELPETTRFREDAARLAALAELNNK